MTEKEMIEEMAKDLKECLPNNWYWQKSVDSDTYFVAKHFYNEGYRKIPEGSVVLTREEYAEYVELRNNEARKKTPKTKFLYVEDGSVDVDNLREELSLTNPEIQIVIYRQGSNPPILQEQK